MTKFKFPALFADTERLKLNTFLQQKNIAVMKFDSPFYLFFWRPAWGSVKKEACNDNKIMILGQKGACQGQQ